MIPLLTEEQLAVVHHPLRRHARVLAVAGSGKTTTMVYRVKQLVEEHRVPPNQICVLMFNVRARRQFEEKLSSVLPDDQRPRVNTFHSYAYGVISRTINAGKMPPIAENWVEDKQEVVRMTVHRAIGNLENRGRVEPDSIDADDAMTCIGLWKASLIPPERAGYRGNPALVWVYQEFERLRLERNAITFDDYVPLAVDILTAEPLMRSRHVNTYDTVIVDEYQDVNLGQETLIEIIAGNRADVIVVGDDDQTIYEWRGARPDYLTGRFQQVFANKPMLDYKLSNTFRFGPVIAQCAQNVITMNDRRLPKNLIAFDAAQRADIQITRDTSEQSTDVSKELASHVAALARKTGDPRSIIVLARLYAQLNGLEAEFLLQGIPYRVIGRQPFYERREIVVLLDYLRLGLAIQEHVSEESLGWLRSVANVPNRRLSRDMLAQTAGRMTHGSIAEMLDFLANNWQTPLAKAQREKVNDLLNILLRIRELVDSHQRINAGDMLTWLITALDYTQHFDHYYGRGEESEDRKKSITAFCAFASNTGKNVPEFLAFVKTLDPTQGLPEEELITMTTVFRVKGEEYDYVILPACVEGSMPFLADNPNMIYDNAAPTTEPPGSAQIENERRLFYVAVTRAKKAVIIGSAGAPMQGNQGKSRATLPSRFLEEMMLTPTCEVMGALQECHSSPARNFSPLIASATKHASNEKIILGLVGSYLPAQKVQLPISVLQQINGVPKKLFSYQLDYGGVGATSKPVVRVAASAPKWWEE